jgi:hypothetical protein
MYKFGWMMSNRKCKCSRANKARDFMIWDFMIKRPFLEQLERNGKPHHPKPKN